MRIAVTLLLSLIVPLLLMGLTPSMYNDDYETNNNRNTQTIVVQGTAPTVEKENYRLDVEWPVVDYEQRTSHFGYRYIPNCAQCSRYHQGLDFTPGEGKAIYSIMDGEIVDAGWDGSFGYRVVIRHVIFKNELEYTTIYAHMQPSIVTKQLQSGNKIAKGEIIGLVGNTGVSTGPHLHFEIHKNEKVLDPIDFFDFHIK